MTLVASPTSAVWRDPNIMMAAAAAASMASASASASGDVPQQQLRGRAGKHCGQKRTYRAVSFSIM